MSNRIVLSMLVTVACMTVSPSSLFASTITEIIDATGDGAGNTLKSPNAVRVDAARNIYIAGSGTDNAFKITPAGVITEIIDWTGDGAGNILNEPGGLAVDTAGNVYVGGFFSHNAFKITPAGVITEIIDSTGDGAGNVLIKTIAIAADAAGNVYVAGWGSDNAFKITPPYGAVNATEIIDSTGDGAGNVLDLPTAIAVDAAGNVYVSGNVSNNVFKITPPYGAANATEIIDITGDGAGNPLWNAGGIAVDGAGNVYVAGWVSDNVFKITPTGVITEIIDSTGDGAGNTLMGASPVAVDATGNVYVTGCQSDNAFMITPPYGAQNATEIIDSTGDGAGNPLEWPVGVAVDDAGQVFVTGLESDNAFKITIGPDEPTLKWEQLPDLASTGMNVHATYGQAYTPHVLADDFECTVTGPLVEIDVWGSWGGDWYPLGDPSNVTFILSIHEDIPADENPPDYYSIPGDLLWLREFGPDEFEVEHYADVPQAWRYVPCPGGVGLWPVDDTLWLYKFFLDPADFRQEGTPDAPMTYWLDVQAFPMEDYHKFFWKTSVDHWNDDAVCGEYFDPPEHWYEIDYPGGHPFPVDAPFDMAFRIIGTEEEPVLVKRPMPENCADIAPGNTCSDDGTCTTDDDCSHESQCVPPPAGESGPGICYAPKHRYISIARNPEQVENTARRISLQGGGAGPWWVGAPYEASGFAVANVVDAPVYADADFTGDWPDLVNVTGCEIATNQTYLVQAIPMGAVITEEANYSAAIALHTPELWGDVVSTCTSYNCQPPDGDVDIDDILAAIGAFQSLNKNPLTWFDIAPALGDGVPNQMADIDDILATIHGFQSQAYPGNGPLGCP